MDAIHDEGLPSRSVDAIAAALPASATSARFRTGRVNSEVSLSAGVRVME